jgi:dTDP-glucose 4,6-dehydratase
MTEMYDKLVKKESTLAVIGLGYVGLPIALEFAKKIKVIGFDINAERVKLMQNNIDPSKELEAKDLTVFGDGSQTRSFCYVDDLVEGICRLLQSDYAEPVNIGNPDEITIGDFAEEIIRLTGTTQKVIYKDLPENDPKKRRPDITKAKEILGWVPKVSRQEGLKLTYDFFKSLTKQELSEVDHYNFDKFIK